MMGSGLTGADALAIAARTDEDRRDDDGFGFGGSGVLIILVLFILFMFNGNGWGFGGGNNMRDVATVHDVNNGFNFAQVDNSLRSIERGLCDLGYATLQQTNQLGQQIAQIGFQQQQCCCETNRNIDAVRAENYKNTCEITTAIHSEGEQTRALITANVIQELRDKASAYELQLSNQAQNAALISALRPFPVPAYITCSPYTEAQFVYGNGNGYGYGYGRSNNCGTCGGCNYNV